MILTRFIIQGDVLKQFEELLFSGFLATRSCQINNQKLKPNYRKIR